MKIQLQGIIYSKFFSLTFNLPFLSRKLFVFLVFFCVQIMQTQAFEISGLRIGDSFQSFEKLVGPAKEFITITMDKNKEIVRVLYIQDNLENNEKIQRHLVERICDKYGFVVACQEALSSINGENDKTFVGFSFVYWNENKTQRLTAKIKRSDIFSFVPELTVEIDLMSEDFYRLLQAGPI